MITNDMTIKAFLPPRITDPAIFKRFPERRYEPFLGYDQSVIALRTIKIFGLFKKNGKINRQICSS